MPSPRTFYKIVPYKQKYMALSFYLLLSSAHHACHSLSEFIFCITKMIWLKLWPNPELLFNCFKPSPPGAWKIRRNKKDLCTCYGWMFPKGQKKGQNSTKTKGEKPHICVLSPFPHADNRNRIKFRKIETIKQRKRLFYAIFSLHFFFLM